MVQRRKAVEGVRARWVGRRGCDAALSRGGGGIPHAAAAGLNAGQALGHRAEAQGMPGERRRSLLFMRRNQTNRNNAGASLFGRESLGEQAPAEQATPCCFWLPRWARVCQEPPLPGLLAC